MKKLIKIWISMCFVVGLLYGCHQEKTYLKLKYDVFHVELGNAIVKEPLCYLDLDGLTDDNINSIRENAKMEVTKRPDGLLSERRAKAFCESEGTYDCSIKYFDETVDFIINVVVNLSPVVLGPNVIAVKKDDVDFDFYQHYSVEAPYRMYLTNIDTSQVNFHKVGDYPAKLLISENSFGDIGYEARQITVKIQDKITYHIPSKKILDVPYYNQMDVDAPNGCEATSLYMALKYKNKINTDLRSFIGVVPQSETPYEGFSGDPFSRATHLGDYYTVFPHALIKATYKYAQMRDISGSDLDQIMDELANDHPVIAWVTGKFTKPVMENYYFGKVTSNLHIVLVNGYDKEKKIFYIKDPADRKLTEVSFQTFQTAYDAMKFAIVVEG